MHVKFTVVLTVCEPRKAGTAEVMYIYCDLITVVFRTHLPEAYVQDSFFAFLFFKTRFIHVGCSI